MENNTSKLIQEISHLLEFLTDLIKKVNNDESGLASTLINNIKNQLYTIYKFIDNEFIKLSIFLVKYHRIQIAKLPLETKPKEIKTYYKDAILGLEEINKLLNTLKL